jgi:hypothetical protein
MGNINLTESEITNIVKKVLENTTDSKKKKTSLTASEVAQLWNQYMGDSSAICIYTYFHKITEDKEIQALIEYALQLSKLHITKITEFFNESNYPIPKGFSIEDDVNLDTPRLISDPLIIFYSEIMTVHGIQAYSLSVSSTERDDIRNYFIECMATASELLNKSIGLLKSRGMYYESPIIPPPDDIEFVEKKGTFSDLFGDPKPLSVTEINNIFFHLKKTGLEKTFSLAFSQVAESEEVRAFLLKTAELAGKHIGEFASLMYKDDLYIPRTWDTEVLNSTISPFSDKLMMFHIGFKLSAAIAYYGTGLATSMRADVITTYSKLIMQVMKCANEWLNIMVKNKWLEQQPHAVDRKALVQR